MRDTLPLVIKSIKESIPDSNIIFVTGNGLIGDLRNKGLMKATSEFVCFVDDDIIVTKEWFGKCIETLKNNENVVCVSGRTKEGYTLGCTVCKAKLFKKLGGFPKLDSLVSNRVKFVVLDDVFCKHLVSELQVFRHLLHWFVHGFYSESKFGFSVGVTKGYKLIFGFLLKRKPSYSLSYLLWFIKAIYVYLIKKVNRLFE